jgi:hypothetical protein
VKGRRRSGVERGTLNFRDHTDKLTEYKQQTARALPPGLRAFLDKVHSDFEAHRKNGMRTEQVANLVFPGIWVGEHAAVFMPIFFVDDEVKSILNMAKEIDYEPWPGIFLAKVGIEDGELSPVGAFEKAALEIHLAKKKGLNLIVHCAAGISRSVAATISYLMLYEGMGFVEALGLIRKGRPQANPHPHLVRSMIRDFGPRFKK